MRRLPALLPLPLLLAAADPATIPPPIRAMLDAALASGNDGEISTIVKYARNADPASGDAVAQLASDWRARRDAARNDAIREARFIDLWSGKVELGGWRTTGNSDTLGLSAAVELQREGLKWRQKLQGQADYQRSQGVITREHYLLAYEPNYKLSGRAYLYGTAQYERDRLLGYDDRLSGSLGAGYSAVKSPALTLDVELGPAYRRTAFTDDTIQHSLAARGSVDLKWKLTGGLSVSQQAAAYLEHYNSTVSSTSALNAKLLGPLSAQLSYNVQYESMPPAGGLTTDTTSRAALVYSF